MNMTKEIIESFDIVGIQVRTSNIDGQGIKDIGNLWNTFICREVLKKIPFKTSDTIYALYTEYEGDHTKPYTTVIGCRVDKVISLPEGMVSKNIEEGTYLKSTAKGNILQGLIGNHWNQIWSQNLDRKYKTDYEVYDDRARDPANATVEFYIGVNN